MVTQRLPAEVAALYEQTTHSTRFYVQRLGREVDLTKLTLAEAAELVVLPGGFEWLKRKEAAPEPAVELTAPEAPKRRPRATKSKGAGGM
ncbi:hypothetical protein Q5H93_14765 [Hymenobacter sp. ASUV-10]|uniref:XRE family transcriptional regulator n=1 Tax=Hymenobacter aranciens TaxID=3063996 RepID=A0ABT9BCN6_9BACT|nr:hypothetical protein [Hymenobacter sp. ASUV-10]MDO7876003.1 hypothetical protein [Hymenobacter sp. ASUV-10]